MFNTNFYQICYVSYKKEVSKKRVWVSLGLSHKSSKASEKRTFINARIKNLDFTSITDPFFYLETYLETDIKIHHMGASFSKNIFSFTH